MDRIDKIILAVIGIVFFAAIGFIMKKNSAKANNSIEMTSNLGTSQNSAEKRLVHIPVARNESKQNIPTVTQETAAQKTAPQRPVDPRVIEAYKALLKRIADIKYHQQKQDEFLKLKVGLSDEEIKQVHQKTNMFRNEIRVLEYLEKKRYPQAPVAKKLAMQRHIVWMNHILGSDNFAQYINL